MADASSDIRSSNLRSAFGISVVLWALLAFPDSKHGLGFSGAPGRVRRAWAQPGSPYRAGTRLHHHAFLPSCLLSRMHGNQACSPPNSSS